MARIAVIDLGTVTERLAIAEYANGNVSLIEKHSTIVNLGEGVDTSRLISEEALARACETTQNYLRRIEDAKPIDAVCCTMTSAARDATNSDELIAAFRKLGLEPQVIPGEVEGSLTFLGVSHDLPNTRIIVADNGGGSTELAVGRLEQRAAGPELNLEWVHSVDVGCRRINDRFFADEDPPAFESLAEAHAFVHQAFCETLLKSPVAGDIPKTLVVTGGTATSLVAIEKELSPYDSSQVHLETLSLERLDCLERRLSALSLDERKEVVGLQAQRAAVIVGGIVCVRELMEVLGSTELVVSESDLLLGLSFVVGTVLAGESSPLTWTPVLS